MGSILGNAAVKEAIRQIAIRTEREDPKEALDSFYDCDIISHLTSINHQIIQGRRGTGKTHILLVLKNKLENEKRHCIYYDCKAAGSAANISETSLPEKHRVIQLIRDFLLHMYKDLLKYYDEELRNSRTEKALEINCLLDQLHSECYESGQTIQKYESSTNKRQKKSRQTSDAVKIPQLLNMFATGIDLKEDRQKEQESSDAHNTTGISYEKVVFPNVSQCLIQLAELTGKSFVILIDEWSNLSLDIQPHFAEFLRHCFIGSRRITLKIAVVKGRTRYCIKNNSIVYGLEIGADISVDMDLDSIYLYDQDPERVMLNLYEILLTHLKAKGVVGKIDVKYFIQTLFEDFKSAILLVRASEGNPRDFISIVNCCLIKIRNPGDWLNSKIILDAANAWYRNDKENALSPLQKQILSELSDYVVQRKRTRGFVIDEPMLNHIGIRSLVDARVLHIVQTGRRFPNLGKGTMAILVLDFGIYADYLRMNQNIHFLTDDVYETEIFSEYPTSRYDDTLYLFDEKRRFQMCFLDPMLDSNICPSFQELID